ncbi:MAG: NAD(+) synthase, partial [Acholeplasmataceae bacterium]|nr:NAD(+) synthase [Acholeplasmataceae bacterium]
MYQHGFIKLAAACLKTRLGDSMYNVKEMINVLKSANKKDPAMVCFPELCITGYSTGDLFFQKYLYQESLNAIKYLLENNPFPGVIIFGSYVVINDTLYNCSIVVQKKKILGIIPKTFLPHTNEFYETRWFASGQKIINDVKSMQLLGQVVPFGKILFENDQKDVIFGAEICGDIWAPTSPNEKLFANGALIVFNSSASPSYIGKNEKRRLLTESTTMKFNSAYVYTSNNASESTSEVVFSSHLLISENGHVLAESDDITLDSKITYADIDILKLHYARRNNSYFKQSQEISRDPEILRVSYDLERSEGFEFEKMPDGLPFVPKNKADFERIIAIQTASVLKRLDYVGTEKTVLGISGGLDSTLALLSLCKAYDQKQINRKNIHALSLPSNVTSGKNRNVTKTLAEKLGVSFQEIPIGEDVSRQLETIGHTGEKDVTYENVQARFRTYTLMNYANKIQGFVIGTSDMSEIALGWSTFNGDHMAMYGLNAGLPKTVIRAMVKHYQDHFPEVKEILEGILDAPITPELSGQNQETEAIIGKYEINDFILYHFLVNGDEGERIIFLLGQVFGLSEKEAKAYVENFYKRFYSQQYKRLTMPEGVKILELSLTRGELKLN